MPDPIKFYSKTTAYQELSNFAPFGFEDDGVYWPTVEHYWSG
jgi:N-glycosidase YbiA